MSEVVIVVIFVTVLFGGVIAYSFFSTSLGYEEDENKNYIPDRFEKIFRKGPVNKTEDDSEEESEK